jgi:hypothetical protein
LAYKNDCDFLKGGEDGNPIGRPDLVEPAQNPDTRVTGSYDALPWSMNDQQQLSTRERSIGPDSGSNVMIPPIMFANHRACPNGGYIETPSSGSNDMSVSSHHESQSNRPTPNSSSASEQRNNSTSRPVTESGQTPYDTSPIGANPSLGTQAELDAASAAFFSDANNYSMQSSGTGMTPGRSFVMPDTSGNHYGVPNGWVMQGQPGMTPVAEGVLRHLMDMPPMDAMDLGWEGA